MSAQTQPSSTATSRGPGASPGPRSRALELVADPAGREGRLEILALAGSLRRGSYNHRLLDAVRGLALPGTRLTVYDDLASVPLFSEDEAAGDGPEGVRRLRAAVGACDGLLIATPEYNQSIPGVLKNALDWLSLARPEAVLKGKPVAILGATTGPWGTRLAQRTLREILFAMGGLVLSSPQIYIRGAKGLFDGDGSLADPATFERLEKLAAAFVEWIERLSPAAAARRRRQQP